MNVIKLLEESDLLICVELFINRRCEFIKRAIENKVKTIEINPSKTLYSDYFDYSFVKKVMKNFQRYIII